MNPIWNSSFTLNGVEEDDMVEVIVTDYGLLAAEHVGGLGPRRVGRCVVKVEESGFVGWKNLDNGPECPNAGCAVLHVTARFAKLQGALPPVGLVPAVADLLGSSASSGGSGGAGSSWQEQQAFLTPSAPAPMQAPVPAPVQVGESGGSEDDVSPLDAAGERRKTGPLFPLVGPARHLTSIAEETEQFGEDLRAGEVGESGGGNTTPPIPVVASTVAKEPTQPLGMLTNQSSRFFIDESVFTFSRLESMQEMLQRISMSPNKHPFPTDRFGNS